MGRQSSTSIYRTLLGEVLNRTLADGTRLPKEQDLATRFGASRSTVRKAIDQLRQDGLIVSRQGDGNYITGMDAGDTYPLRIEASGSFDDIFALRRLLDGHAAADAAIHRDDSALERMAKSLEAFEDQQNAHCVDMIAVRRADIEFHTAISKASPNRMLQDLIYSFAPTVVPYWRAWMELEQVQQKKLVSDTLAEHRMIFTAIDAGDPVIAEAAMRRHFQTNQSRYERLFDSLAQP